MGQPGGFPGFPKAGSQVRRKCDGVLGEVYAVDPPAKLFLRWPTIPGAYAHQECTPEQFAQAWELTGQRIEPARETHFAIALIAASVLLFFAFVLVHDRSSADIGNAAYQQAAADSPALLNSARGLDAKYGMQAAEACAAGADEYIRSITRHRFHWQASDSLTPRFNRFSLQLSAPGVLTLITSKASVSNGFGVFHPIVIICNYDTQGREVLSYAGQDNGQ